GAREGAGRDRAGRSASGLPGQRGGAWPAVSRGTAAPPGRRAAREVLARRIPAPERPRRCWAAPPPSTLGGPGGRRFLTTGRTGLLPGCTVALTPPRADRGRLQPSSSVLARWRVTHHVRFPRRPR